MSPGEPALLLKMPRRLLFFSLCVWGKPFFGSEYLAIFLLLV